MSKKFIGILVAIIIALVGVYALTSKKSDSGSGNNKNNSTASLTKHVTGKNAKKVSFVEYGDFQCPFCGKYYPLIKQVVEKYNNDIEFQFRHFPLQQHQNARAAARSAEAAGAQGKFWEMYDLLYQQQQSWESSTAATSVFESYAEQLKLDMAKYKTDFASSQVNSAINADYDQGIKDGVNSTPSFFLQGKKLDPAPTDLDGFSKAIDEAIKNSK